MASYFEDKVKKPLTKMFKSGISAEKLALSFAFGVSCGVFPVPGLTTLPLVVMTFLFRLNPAAPLLVNYVCTPLNIALTPVFIYYGNLIFQDDSKSAVFSPSDFITELRTSPLDTLQAFRSVLLNGIFAWLLFLPIATSVLYMIFLPITKKGISSMQSKRQTKAK